MAHATQTSWGFEATPEETLAIWEAVAGKWATRKSPWRAAAADIVVYRRLAGPRLGGRVLLMGVTPELRDLVAEAGGRPVLVDMSAAMYASTTRLLRRADPSRETWIHCEWGEAPLPAGEFDLVLGDMIWWGVSVARQHALRDAIHDALKPDALFVGRFRFADPGRAHEDPVAAIGHYLEQLDRTPRDVDRIEGDMMSWLYDHTANRELLRLDRERARDLLLGLAERPEFRRHREFLREAASSRLIGANWTSQSREELLEVIGARFAVVREGRAEGYDSSLYPILALRRG